MKALAIAVITIITLWIATDLVHNTMDLAERIASTRNATITSIR